MQMDQAILKSHSDYEGALYIVQTLKSQGFEAVFAGGCVRDSFLGRKAKDIDVATSARPQEVQNLFSKTVLVGEAFGVVRVIQSHSIEVSTFRKDGIYTDGRRPNSVQWATMAEDALRRDFTINALFYDPIADKVFDFVEGIKDLQNKKLRCVGDAKSRFQEDHLRILRLARFASQLDFTIDLNTQKAAAEMAPHIATVSRERFRDEMEHLLTSLKPLWGLELGQQWGLWQAGDKYLYSHFQDLISFWAKTKSYFSHWSREQQSWVLFFMGIWQSSYPDYKSDIKTHILSYKLSRVDTQRIEEVLHFYSCIIEFLDQPLGYQLRLAENETVRWVLEFFKENTKVISLQEELHRRKLLGKYPEALLKGEDIPMHITPPQRGDWLNKAYEVQLEKSISHKETLLQVLVKKI